MDKIFEDFKNQIMDKYLAIETENNELKKQNQELTTDKLLTENVVEHLHATIDERDDRIQSLIDEIKELEQEVEQLKQEKQNAIILKAQEKMAKELPEYKIEYKNLTIQDFAKKIKIDPHTMYKKLTEMHHLKRIKQSREYYVPINNAKQNKWLIAEQIHNGYKRIMVTPKGQKYYFKIFLPENLDVQKNLI